MTNQSEQPIDSLLKERGERYGDFEEHAKVTQKLKTMVREEVGWNRLTYAQREALDMVFHKIGRIVCGDPDYKDSWTDIIGYVRLVEKTLT